MAERRSATYAKYLANPEKRAHHNDLCIAGNHRRRNAAGAYSPQEWREKVGILGGRCFYCGSTPTVLERDHIVPIARGGTNDIWNLVPACRSCNAKKWRRTAMEYFDKLALAG